MTLLTIGCAKNMAAPSNVDLTGNFQGTFQGLGSWSDTSGTITASFLQVGSRVTGPMVSRWTMSDRGKTLNTFFNGSLVGFFSEGLLNATLHNANGFSAGCQGDVVATFDGDALTGSVTTGSCHLSEVDVVTEQFSMRRVP